MDGRLRLTLVYTEVSMKMSWKRTSIPGGLIPTLHSSDNSALSLTDQNLICLTCLAQVHMLLNAILCGILTAPYAP